MRPGGDNKDNNGGRGQHRFGNVTDNRTDDDTDTDF